MNENRRQIVMLGTSPSTRGGIASVVKTYQSAALFENWPIEYLSTHADGGPARKFLIAFRAWSLFVTKLLRGQEFLVHVHCASRASFWRKTAFIIPALWTKRPVIFHLHGGGFVEFYDECGYFAQGVVRHVLDNCDRIVVLSESWRTAISKITSNSQIQVIVNPASPSSSVSLAESRMPGVLLFLGRLDEAKGIYVLLEALAVLAKEGVEFRLICGGDGDLDEIERAVVRLGLDERVELLGWVDEARRAKLLAQASIYVLPSFTEGLPMGILEAMSASLPVVTTPVGGIPEVITDGVEGLLVPAGNASALGCAISKLLSNSKLRTAMGSRGRHKFSSCFDATVVLPKLEAIYREFGVRPKRKM